MSVYHLASFEIPCYGSYEAWRYMPPSLLKISEDYTQIAKAWLHNILLSFLAWAQEVKRSRVGIGCNKSESMLAELCQACQGISWHDSAHCSVIASRKDSIVDYSSRLVASCSVLTTSYRTRYRYPCRPTTADTIHVTNLRWHFKPWTRISASWRAVIDHLTEGPTEKVKLSAWSLKTDWC